MNRLGAFACVLRRAFLFGLLSAACAASALAQGVTFSGRQIQTGGQYQLVGDFNADGRSDLVTAGLDVEVLLGLGDGTFQPNAKYPVGTSLSGIDRGDFNGDGKWDVAVSIVNPIEVGILLGNGDGTFGPVARYPTNSPASPTSVVVADFNADGRADLLTSDPFNCLGPSCSVHRVVTLMQGNGDGTFQTPRQIEVGTPVHQLTVGDFNRDSIPDVAGAAAFGKVVILVGNGDGTFRQPPDVPIVQNVDNTDVAVGDFNGDTFPDLVAAADGESRFGVALGNGDGTFRPASIITDALMQRGWRLEAADFNRDGRLDVAIGFGHCCIDVGSGAFGLMFGNGDGTFQPITRHIRPNNGRISLAAIDPVAADFNGDGRVDAAAMFHNAVGGSTRGTIILTNTTGTTPARLALGTMNAMPATVVGGTRTTINLSLAPGAVAPSGNIAFSLSNSNPSVAALNFSTTSPPFVMVQGMTNLHFYVDTNQVTSTQTVTITVSEKRLGNRSVRLTVTPPSEPLALGSLEVTPSVFAGSDGSGAVSLTTGHVAPIGGVVVSLTNGNPSLISMPASVTIPAGQTTAGFPIQTETTGTTTNVPITASYGGVTKTATMTVTAPTKAVPISSVTVSPSTVTAGSQWVRLTVTLAANAPTEGANIMLRSSRPDVVAVPRSIRIFFSTQNSTFTDVMPMSVAAPTDVTITAAFGDSVMSAVRTVLPPPAGPALTGLTLNPSSVTGGGTSQGTVTLGSAASSPTTVALASSSAPSVTVPSSVTVPAGATSASFTVSTTSVSSSAETTITATLGGASRSAVLTITPAADTVSIGRAEYISQDRVLRVEATSTRTNATLQVYVTSSGQIIGTLTNLGGGKYGGQLNWSTNPQNITVRSSFGGQATRTVELK